LPYFTRKSVTWTCSWGGKSITQGGKKECQVLISKKERICVLQKGEPPEKDRKEGQMGRYGERGDADMPIKKGGINLCIPDGK